MSLHTWWVTGGWQYATALLIWAVLVLVLVRCLGINPPWEKDDES